MSVQGRLRGIPVTVVSLPLVTVVAMACAACVTGLGLVMESGPLRQRSASSDGLSSRLGLLAGPIFAPGGVEGTVTGTGDGNGTAWGSAQLVNRSSEKSHFGLTILKAGLNSGLGSWDRGFRRG